LSGDDLSRPQLLAMRDAALRGEFEWVLAENFDRITRADSLGSWWPSC